MTIYRFEQIKATGKKRVPCEGGCGKKVSRQMTFTKTVNPFNKNADGTVKTREEVRESVQAEAGEWQRDETGEWCTPCREAADSEVDHG
jgi:hypothetical protein